MLDEQQEATTDEGGADVGEDASTPTAPEGERAPDEPVDAAKGPDAGEGEVSHSGEEEDPVGDQAEESAEGDAGAEAEAEPPDAEAEPPDAEAEPPGAEAEEEPAVQFDAGGEDPGEPGAEDASEDSEMGGGDDDAVRRAAEDEESRTAAKEYVGQDTTVVHSTDDPDALVPTEYRTAPGVNPGLDPGKPEERDTPPRPPS